MNKVISILIFAAFILTFTGCKKKRNNNVIYDTIGRKIEMNIHKCHSTQFTILRYIDNPSCTSSQLKLGEWKIYHKKLKKKFGDKVNLFFLCETKNIKDARFLFEIYGFDDMAVVDSSINFYDTYKLNPILGKDVVFLLDSTNTILSIGNPNDNLKINSLFTSLMLGNFSKNK